MAGYGGRPGLISSAWLDPGGPTKVSSTIMTVRYAIQRGRQNTAILIKKTYYHFPGRGCGADPLFRDVQRQGGRWASLQGCGSCGPGKVDRGRCEKRAGTPSLPHTPGRTVRRTHPTHHITGCQPPRIVTRKSYYRFPDSGSDAGPLCRDVQRQGGRWSSAQGCACSGPGKADRRRCEKRAGTPSLPHTLIVRDLLTIPYSAAGAGNTTSMRST